MESVLAAMGLGPGKRHSVDSSSTPNAGRRKLRGLVVLLDQQTAKAMVALFPHFGEHIVNGHIEDEKLSPLGIRFDATPPPAPPMPTGGPGTELKRILAAAGFSASGCQCDARAAEMDAKGVAWCRANTGTIVGWLADAAKERGFPFSRTAGHLLVWAAIAAARRKSTIDDKG